MNENENEFTITSWSEEGMTEIWRSKIKKSIERTESENQKIYIERMNENENQNLNILSESLKK